MIGPAVIVVDEATRTPCCDRVPVTLDGRRYGCRGCGQVFVSARAVVETVFGPCVVAR